MTNLLRVLLAVLARCYLWRFSPRVVAITGNVGKTTTKDAVAAVLATRYRVRATMGNLNNELGVPLTVMGDFAEAYYRRGGSIGFWMSALASSIVGFVRSRDRYPEVLVLEFGADRPGDIQALSRSYRPKVGVITAVGDIPVHVEYFASPAELAQEKGALIRSLAPDGVAVLNGDDPTVMELRPSTRASVVTFGMTTPCTVRAGRSVLRMDDNRPVGIKFDLEANGIGVTVQLDGVLGDGVLRAAAAAVAVGQAFGIELVTAAQALSGMRMPAGRLRIISGIKDTVLIDDTYNASPAAMRLAIDAIRELPMRKVLVLGDMLELGEYSMRAHQEIGAYAADVADVLICVGLGGLMMADAAQSRLPEGRLHRCNDSREAGQLLQRVLEAGDVVLIKGSQGVRMERVVREVMADPLRAGEVLVRQSARWLAKE